MSFIYLTESQMGQPLAPHPSAPSPPSDVTSTPGKKLRRQSSSSSRPKDDAGGGGGEHRKDDMQRINRLFEILSARSDVDHPICVDCTDMLVEGFQKKLDVSARERDAYIKHLRHVQANQPSQEDVEAQRDATAKAEAALSEAMSNLRTLEQEKEELDKEILSLEEESRRLDAEEDRFWGERNVFAAQMTDFQSERDSVNVRYSNDSQLLQKLQRSNVYNDTFNISHDGSFATINGLRLGRLSSKPVDWPEINAAWGHALLLLVTVADELGYAFQGYEAHPQGSTSRIVRYELSSPSSSRHNSARASSAGGSGGGAGGGGGPPPKKHVLELYSSGDMPLGLTFMHRKFDNAMVAFLELTRQLGVHVHAQTLARGKPLELPYPIDGDRIGDVSIKLGMTQDDGWTKACKLTLTCCKFLLAHASNVSVGHRGPGP